jgi:hypothetical protein
LAAALNKFMASLHHFTSLTDDHSFLFVPNKPFFFKSRNAFILSLPEDNGLSPVQLKG